MSKIRIDKWIADSTPLSRKEAHILLRAGKVLLNGRPVRDIGAKADTDTDELAVDGQPVWYQKYFYAMLNKPAGVLSASTDKKRETVVDIVSRETGRKGLFPVGRLDKDTTGLLIITDDGEFAHKVISPNSHVEKEYLAILDAPVGPAETAALAAGVTLADGQVCRPAMASPADNTGTVCSVVITEGKYHQIKRMFGTLGIGVNGLKRLRIGRLRLDEKLPEGAFRELTAAQAALALEQKE